MGAPADRDGKATGGTAFGGRGRRRTVLAIGAVVVGMLGLSYASVPLYRLFCQVTGYGGTTQVAASASHATIDRSFTIRFDASVNPALDWAFRPKQISMRVKAGENALAFYEAVSSERRAVVGTAVYNVTPDKAGLYFNKVQCFCFTEQVLKPGERVDMPVSFFIDPDVAKDPNMADVTTITLSYTFFRAEDQSAATRVNTAALDRKTN